MIYKYLLKPLLFSMEAEKAHDFAVNTALRLNAGERLRSAIRGIYSYQSLSLVQAFWGLTFRNPVGLAAGFDKNGRLVNAVENLGMGFTEVGSITAKASAGNEKPRAFRLSRDEAIINRMGLNNRGARTVVRSMQRSDIMPVGMSIAKTPDAQITGDGAVRDYQISYNEAVKTADYITINISCPNTSDGRTFEEPEALKDLLGVLPESDERNTPTLVKFSPDLTEERLSELLLICENYDIDGYAACNTSSARDNLKTDSSKLEAIGRGGLSGRPIFDESIAVIEQIRGRVGPEKPIIGMGGIRSFETALQMMKAGANLLQIYTGLVYEGPGLVKRINKGLDRYLKKRGLNSLNKLNESTV